MKFSQIIKQELKQQELYLNNELDEKKDIIELLKIDKERLENYKEMVSIQKKTINNLEKINKSDKDELERLKNRSILKFFKK